VCAAPADAAAATGAAIVTPNFDPVFAAAAGATAAQKASTATATPIMVRPVRSLCLKVFLKMILKSFIARD
jgi:hypothetical protein